MYEQQQFQYTSTYTTQQLLLFSFKSRRVKIELIVNLKHANWPDSMLINDCRTVRCDKP